MSGSGIKTLANNRGFASVEATVLLVLLVALIYYAFGFFGVIHTGIVHNIHARTYAVETFRHRANLMYFRSNRGTAPQMLHYYNRQVRLHGINSDSGQISSRDIATERPISMGLALEESGRRWPEHQQVSDQSRIPDSGRNTSLSINPVWIRVRYGICLTRECGG